MSQQQTQRSDTDKLFFWACIFIMAIGIYIRVVVLRQNRNLMIDEVNLARNIYEKGFADFFKPLSYEQYAPPFFLWAVKACALLFGYGEQALRLYPFLTSVGSIFLLFFILKELTSYQSLWLPLGLFVGGYIFIRYGTELKQYSSDIFVVLALILLALRTNMQGMKPGRFFIRWALVGSIAIWACMPSVFILAGVGAYYAYGCIRAKQYNKIMLLAGLGVFWVLQFALYYFAVLNDQIHSSYLQNFHEAFFLNPHFDKEAIKHNYYVCRDLLSEAAGFHYQLRRFHMLLLLLGVIELFRKRTAAAFLILIPLLAVIAAAMAHQFSLIPRVALFMMPMLLIVMGCGFELLMSVRSSAWQAAMCIVGILSVGSFQSVSSMKDNPFSFEQVTETMDFFKKEGIKAEQLYVDNGARPAVIYYTQIHPHKERWAEYKNAHLMEWDAKYDSLAVNIPDPRIAFMYSSISGNDLTAHRSAIDAHRKEVSKIEKWDQRSFGYIYERPDTAAHQ